MDDLLVVDGAGVDELFPDDLVDRGRVVVGADGDAVLFTVVVPVRGLHGEVGQGVGLGVPEFHLVPFDEVVEHLGGVGPGPHPQSEVGVLGVHVAVGGAEPVHGGQFDLGGCPLGDHVQDTAAADGGQLPAVPDEHHPGVGVVGDVQQGAGGFLVEHPGLVHHQHVTGVEPCGGVRAACTPAR